MADHAVSDDPAVQAQLDRLNAMTPGRDVLGRSRFRRLLGRLGNPERSLPPTFHVAGTNGKGSTCTYLRGAIAAQELTAHVYTSPHLVRLNERIRVANRLVADADLAALLAEVIGAVEAGDEHTTFFEATTAAAFLAFARARADACILEVGIGGRLDATNVIPAAAACGIAQLGIDHQAFLGDKLEDIAAEKAGIAKPGTPLVTLAYPPRIAAVIEDVAAAAGAPVLAQGRDWDIWRSAGGLRFSDAQGELPLPLPALAGEHQIANAGLATAMLRAQSAVPITPAAIARGLADARWPARLARLAPGPLTALAPKAEIWLDGAHNVAAMEGVAAFMAGRLPAGARLPVVLGLLADKDLAGVLACLSRLPCDINAVPIAGYNAHSADTISAAAQAAGLEAQAHPTVEDAVRAISGSATIALITGSLYLAGAVLRANGELPD